MVVYLAPEPGRWVAHAASLSRAHTHDTGVDGAGDAVVVLGVELGQVVLCGGGLWMSAPAMVQSSGGVGTIMSAAATYARRQQLRGYRSWHHCRQCCAQCSA